jgi:hypothetical protein
LNLRIRHVSSLKLLNSWFFFFPTVAKSEISREQGLQLVQCISILYRRAHCELKDDHESAKKDKRRRNHTTSINGKVEDDDVKL